MSQSKKSEIYAGFVVGSDEVGRNKKTVWKVRVTAPGSLCDKKFEVATSHVLLKKGMEVQFQLCFVRVGQKKVRKAAEVQLLQRGEL